MKLLKMAAAAAVLCCAMLSPLASAADIPAATMSSLWYFNNVESTVLGWQFQVNSPITVNGLGYYDYTSDSPQPALFCCTPDNRTSGGLLDNHLVGIYDSGQNLLTSATIPAGTAGTLIDNFRYTAIPSITLNPGLYVIAGTQQGSGGVDPTDPVVFGGAGGFLFASLSTIPEISDLLGRSGFGISGTLTYPDLACCGYTAYMGPNFLVGPAVAVPEPPVWSVILLMLAATGWFWRQASRRI